jgi:cytochrome c-type biogenesis protein CcmH
MRRLALPTAIAALLALGALVLVDAVRPVAPLTQAEHARQLAAELRCPDCQALSVAESQTAAAAAIRRQIVEQLSAGRSEAQVRDYFIQRYGEWILLAPTSPLAWLLPVAALVAGIGLLAWWLLRRRSVTPSPGAPPPDPAIQSRLRDEVERLDA